MTLRFVGVLLVGPFVILYLMARRLIVGSDATDATAEEIGQRFKRFVIGREGSH